jgi:hypothetical protein
MAFDSAHEITDSINLPGDHVRDLKAWNPILYSNQQFETIKAMGSEVPLKTRIVRQT